MHSVLTNHPNPLDNQQMNITIRLTICLFAMLCMGGTAGSLQDERALGFYHIHTTEQLSVTYFRDGEYLPEAMDQLQAFLADWRDGERKDIDPRLMDILWDIQQASGTDSMQRIFWTAILVLRNAKSRRMLPIRYYRSVSMKF
jgi:uncharacterized protein YcbK (DUF882 family)